MKKLGDIMAELGFNKGSSLKTQKAFVKNLIQQAQQNSAKSSATEPEQLSFEFQDQGPCSQVNSKKSKKSA